MSVLSLECVGFLPPEGDTADGAALKAVTEMGVVKWRQLASL